MEQVMVTELKKGDRILTMSGQVFTVTKIESDENGRYKLYSRGNKLRSTCGRLAPFTLIYGK